jgi:hypothetical protein
MYIRPETEMSGSDQSLDFLVIFFLEQIIHDTLKALVKRESDSLYVAVLLVNDVNG